MINIINPSELRNNCGKRKSSPRFVYILAICTIVVLGIATRLPDCKHAAVALCDLGSPLRCLLIHIYYRNALFMYITSISPRVSATARDSWL